MENQNIKIYLLYCNYNVNVIIYIFIFYKLFVT